MSVTVPGWIKAAALLGAPTVISLYLTWWITGRVSEKQDRTYDLLRPHIDASHEMRKALHVIIDIERIQCVNAASTDQERAACLRAGTQVYLEQLKDIP